MTAMTSSFKADLREDPRDLERDADRARADIEYTLHALEERISPAALMDRTMRAVRHSGSDFGRNLAIQVRNNPMPTILAGLGIAWLMAAGDRPPRRHNGDSLGRNGDGRMSDRISSAASSTRSAAGHAARSTRSAAQHAAQSTRSAAGSAASAARGMAGGVASVSRSLRDGYVHMGHEQPLALGALAIAAGAALGALLPSTEAEDEWLGEHSDDATERLKSEARDKWEDAKEAAADTAERAVHSGETERHGESSSATAETSPAAMSASTSASASASPTGGGSDKPTTGPDTETLGSPIGGTRSGPDTPPQR